MDFPELCNIACRETFYEEEVQRRQSEMPFFFHSVEGSWTLTRGRNEAAYLHFNLAQVLCCHRTADAKHAQKNGRRSLDEDAALRAQHVYAFFVSWRRFPPGVWRVSANGAYGILRLV
jgi:hypothetical protein